MHYICGANGSNHRVNNQLHVDKSRPRSVTDVFCYQVIPALDEAAV
jgi:hypothetical protein